MRCRSLPLVIPDRAAARHRAGARPAVPRQRDDGRTGLRRRFAIRDAAGDGRSPRCSRPCWPAVAAGGAGRHRPHAGNAQRSTARRAIRARSAPASSARSAAAARWCTRRRPTRTARCAACSCSASRGNLLEIALAQRATHAYSEGGDLQVITLYDGERYEGIPGERQFRIVRFAENTIPVRLPAHVGRRAAARRSSDARAARSSQRPASARPSFTGASPCRSWRVVMALIAVPLARLRPRQGRYARVGFAMLDLLRLHRARHRRQVLAGARRHARVVRPVVGARAWSCCSAPGSSAGAAMAGARVVTGATCAAARRTLVAA